MGVRNNTHIFYFRPKKLWAEKNTFKVLHKILYNRDMRKYTLNENYFDKIDSPDKSYFLGYLMADGYNSEIRGVIEVSCAVKDREFLGRLNCLIRSSKPLRFVQCKEDTSYRMSLCSRWLSNKLANLGCVQAKTFKVVFPNYLNEEMIPHFLRGYFDGDGCISYSFAKRDNFFGNSFLSVITITSTEEFCLYIKNYIKGKLNINSSILCRHPGNKNNNRTLQISGNNQVIKFAEWIYADTTLFLGRKYDKLLYIKEEIKRRNLIVSKIRSKNGRIVMMDINKRRKNVSTTKNK